MNRDRKHERDVREERTMSNEPKGALSRRRFLLWVVAGGTTVAAGTITHRLMTNKEHSPGLPRDMALVRNPAYHVEESKGGILLRTHTAEGAPLYYKTDESARQLWENVATRDEAEAGRRTTVGEVIEATLARYPDSDAGKIKREASSFLEEAIGAGIFLGASSIVYHRYEGPRA